MGSVLLGRPSLERVDAGCSIASPLDRHRCDSQLRRLGSPSAAQEWHACAKNSGGKKHTSSANWSNGRTVNRLSTLACLGQCCGCSKVDYTGAVYPAGAKNRRGRRRLRLPVAHPQGDPAKSRGCPHTLDISAIYPRAHRPTLGSRMIDPCHAAHDASAPSLS
jgi:hypothetical protein